MCFIVSDSIMKDTEAMEDDETFRLSITTVDPNDPRIRVTDPSTTVIIRDSDGERLLYHCRECHYYCYISWHMMCLSVM